MAGSGTKLSLTNFMDYARMGMVILGIFLVMVTVFEIGRAAITGMSGEYVAGEVEVPDYGFGGVPGIRFPYQAASERPTSYDWKAGTVPTFGVTSLEGLTIGTVYRLPETTYSLTTDQRARQIALNLEFYDEPRIIDQRTYLYTYPGPPLQENLQIDLKTMFVTLTTNYLSSTNIFGTLDARGNRLVPQRLDAINAVKKYLDVAGILPADLSDQASSVDYMTSIGDSLQPVNSALEADYAVVSLSRSPLPGMRDGKPDNFNFYGPEGYGSIHAIVGRDTSGDDYVVELTDNYYEMDYSDSATYLMRTTAQAWESLQNGDAYVINPRGVHNAVIRSVELGYYESHDEQDFLLPIYVFKGDNGVMAYVQALDSRMYY